MECPCTDKWTKKISEYSTIETGVCKTQVNKAESCFTAAVELGLRPIKANMTVNNDKYPTGRRSVPSPPPRHTHTHTHRPLNYSHRCNAQCAKRLSGVDVPAVTTAYTHRACAYCFFVLPPLSAP